jgi:hypothetical protein
MEKQGFFIAKTKVGGFHPTGQALYGNHPKRLTLKTSV